MTVRTVIVEAVAADTIMVAQVGMKAEADMKAVVAIAPNLAVGRKCTKP